jgi:hypothetical protein
MEETAKKAKAKEGGAKRATAGKAGGRQEGQGEGGGGQEGYGRQFMGHGQTPVTVVVDHGYVKVMVDHGQAPGDSRSAMDQDS